MQSKIGVLYIFGEEPKINEHPYEKPFKLYINHGACINSKQKPNKKQLHKLRKYLYWYSTTY